MKYRVQTYNFKNLSLTLRHKLTHKHHSLFIDDFDNNSLKDENDFVINFVFQHYYDIYIGYVEYYSLYIKLKKVNTLNNNCLLLFRP